MLIFPHNFDSDMKYTLGAFVLGSKMKILKEAREENPFLFQKADHIHKTLSKYTHKDLSILLNWDRKISLWEIFDLSSNQNTLIDQDNEMNRTELETCFSTPQTQGRSISLIFMHFYREGMDFFHQQDTVQKHEKVYIRALDKFRKELVTGC
uniref:Uncharacterized protein n=1 Tax=Euplotes crassus TaxID=5936 RepID=A0A7S3KPZ9_EUPCR|mmetsp:Transcript_33759/g.33255  ORF Transcript_33759/g.33255 Transcript_33759/m.33255 type:complete len:152 (+) Transcript_33759:473-928(+)